MQTDQSRYDTGLSRSDAPPLCENQVLLPLADSIYETEPEHDRSGLPQHIAFDISHEVGYQNAVSFPFCFGKCRRPIWAATWLATIFQRIDCCYLLIDPTSQRLCEIYSDGDAGNLEDALALTM